MKLYTIFFKQNPVFGGKDGMYWLGGSPSKLYPGALIFNSKKEANDSLKGIQKEIDTNSEYEGSILRTHKLTVKKIILVSIL